MGILSDKDFYSGKLNPYEEVHKGALSLLGVMDEIIAKGKQLSSIAIGNIQSNQKQTTNDIRALTTETTKLYDINKSVVEINKQKKLLQDQLTKSTDQEVKARLRYNEAVKQQKKELTQLLKYQKAEIGSVNKLNAANAILRSRVKEISSSTEEGRKRIMAYNKAIDRNTLKVTQLSDAQTRQFKTVGNYKTALTGVGSALGLFTSGTLLAAAAIRKSISTIKDAIQVNREFEKSFANVLTLLDKAEKAKFEDILAIGAVDLMAKYGLEISDVNNALFDTISNGIEAGDAIEFLDKSAKLAIAGNAELTDVIKGSTKVYAVYKDEVQNVDEILNAFFAAQVEGATNVQLLANNIGKVAGTAKKAGIPINELFGTFAGLTKFLDGTEESATGLVNVINSLIAVTPQAEAEFKKYGIETGITAIKQNGLLKTILQVIDATSKNEDVLVDLIPNIRAFKGLAGLSAETIAELEENIKKLNDQELSASLLQEAFNEQISTGKKQSDLLKGSWNRLLITIGGGESIFKKISTAIRSDLNKEITKLTKNVELLKLTWNRLFGDLTKEEYQKALYELEKRFSELEVQLEDTNKSINDNNILSKEQIVLINKYNKELDANLKLTKESYDIAKKYYDNNVNSGEKEIETIEVLNKKLQQLEKEKKEIATNDIQRIIDVEKWIEKIKEEINTLENLNKVLSEKPEDIEINVDSKINYEDTSGVLGDLEKARLEEINNFTKNALEVREDIYNKHYDNLFQLFANYKTKKQIEGQNYSAEEIRQIDSQNQQTAAAYQQLSESLISIYNSISDAKLNQLQTEIDAQNQRISEQEQAVNRELQLLQSGASNEYQTEKEKLRKLQSERERNYQKQKDLQKKQQTVNTLIQISELATAVATIINSAVSELGWVGIVAGLAAAAAAIVGFSTYKTEAESAAYAEKGGSFIAKDGAFIEKGNRHSQGGNTYDALNTESGELHSVLSRKATRKYGNLFENLTNAANNDKLNSDQLEMYKYSIARLDSPNIIINNNNKQLLDEIRVTNMLLSSRKIPFLSPKGKIVFYDIYGSKKYTKN